MLEEWYYVDTNTSYPNGHFRHDQKANVVFCDGHVGLENPVPGSMDHAAAGPICRAVAIGDFGDPVTQRHKFNWAAEPEMVASG